MHTVLRTSRSRLERFGKLRANLYIYLHLPISFYSHLAIERAFMRPEALCRQVIGCSRCSVVVLEVVTTRRGRVASGAFR